MHVAAGATGAALTTGASVTAGAAFATGTASSGVGRLSAAVQLVLNFSGCARAGDDDWLLFASRHQQQRRKEKAGSAHIGDPTQARVFDAT
ncbi:hypothetical protein WMF37_02455 [Sorangium sp. So ce291]|uniref:hypothetical protein n=1 Tax=Sorangium sp. So ce291 TaxID=3133294 RepID=UPI003F644BBD